LFGSTRPEWPDRFFWITAERVQDSGLRLSVWLPVLPGIPASSRYPRLTTPAGVDTPGCARNAGKSLSHRS